jgi:hypothetical protein
MIIQGNQFGDIDLGWGWKSIASKAKSVGKGAYNVAKMPAAMARRVASATAGVLCDKDGNPRGSDSTSVNYCRAVKLKQTATLTKYLPAAAAAASKAQAVRKAALQTPTNTAGFGSPCDPSGRAMKLWRGSDGKVTWAFASPKDIRARKACDVPASAAEYAEGRGFGDPDMNLLASLAGADANDLAYALAGVTPVDIGAVNTNDVMLFGPALAAMGAGLWMLFRG